MTYFKVAIFSCILFTAFSSPVAAAPSLESDSDSASAGYFRLSWAAEGATSFVLQESGDPSFANATILYQGPDTATLISGRPNGIFYYRVRSSHEKNHWSGTAEVHVLHHPLNRAFLFFSLGACIFIATLIVVIRGNLASRQ